MSYLSPQDVTAVMGTSRRLRAICRDDGFWKNFCFDNSRLASTLRRRNWRTKHASPRTLKARRTEIRAAWNAAFEHDERAAWYDEFIHRHAPVVTSWFELPRRQDGTRLLDNADVLEVCGVALYQPSGATVLADREVHNDDKGDGDENDHELCGIPTLLAVAPLEDGSVCLWDVNGTVNRRGAIVQQSAPGLLFSGVQNHPRNPSQKMPVFSVTECVAVDSSQHLAYFAVENSVVEVDLQRLSVVGVETYAQAVSALSAAHPSVPLSVGTSAGIHFYDARNRKRSGLSASGFESVDEIAARSTQCAPFPTPGPLSIVHVQNYGSEDTISNDIFAAGRISSILHYDRRKLSVVKSAIHSGASLSSLASLPYPFPALREYSHLSENQAWASQFTWRTIVACGEYKSKGSLELYPVDEGHGSWPMVNRQTSSSAKIFSVISHGRQLALSDGAGYIRWFERDGFTEVRRYNLGSDDYTEEGDEEEEAERRMAAEAQGTRLRRTSGSKNSVSGVETGDIARKLLATKASSNNSAGKGSFESNDLLFWTGEKLGLLTFSLKPGTRAADFDDDKKTAAERATKMEGDVYRARMRRIFQSARYFGENSDSDD
ncbi:hypothetical protein SEPCBS57363_000336 [Sporothrix epigloea]|uniref:F-box domain-containing protein n=1 Tax=Sporothrix epigloea TaxID=1892477 RepID=A0ABP0D786_9PEZI